MDKAFLIDPVSNHVVYYEDLLRLVANSSTAREVIFFENFEQFAVQLLTNLSRSMDAIITDDPNYIRDSNSTLINIDTLDSSFDLQLSLRTSRSSITIFTSGTTGRPKPVVHSVQRFIEMTRIGSNYEGDIWAYLFNPTHMAGLQVFFQAVVNLNTMVYLFESSRKQFLKAVNNLNVTHVSATPTFYRLLAPFDFKLTKVKKVTLGGEKSTSQLLRELEIAFPSAQINNIYASTEAGTLFVSKGETFTILPDYKDRVRIMENEIQIHHSLLGNFQKDEWFSTGDLIEYLDEGEKEFKIVSRSNEVVNIGGNRISLQEVERELLSLPEVKNARVFAKDNSVLGKVVAAELVPSHQEVSKRAIKKALSEKMPDYMVPMSISIVEKIAVTRTGKIKRA